MLRDKINNAGPLQGLYMQEVDYYGWWAHAWWVMPHNIMCSEVASYWWIPVDCGEFWGLL